MRRRPSHVVAGGRVGTASFGIVSVSAGFPVAPRIPRFYHDVLQYASRKPER